MKLLLTADTHCHPFSEFSSTEGADNVNTRLVDCLDTLRAMRRYCRKHDIHVLVIAGDLFHKRGLLYTQTYNEVVKVFSEFKKSGITILCVDGNHDQANKSGSIHAIQALNDAGLVLGIKPDIGWENWTLDDEVVVSGFSYCDSQELLSRRLALSTEEHHKTSGTLSRIGVFHHGFVGARQGSALEYMVKEEVDPSVLKRCSFDYVFSGHYHACQMVSENPPLLYIGAPLEHVRGEPHNKGFIVYDTKTQKIKVESVKAPRFITVGAKKWKPEQVAGHFVDVYYDTDDDVEKILILLRDAGARGVKLVRKKVVVEEKTARLDVDPTLDPKTILERYVDYKHEDTERLGLDKSEVLSLGLDILRKAEE